MSNQVPNVSEGNSQFKLNVKAEGEDILLHKYNLFQQFFVIGIDTKIVHLLNQIEFKSIPLALMSPKIITKYPNVNLPYLNIPDSAIVSHCFPKGFRNTVVECEDNHLNEKLQKTYDFIFSFDNYQMDQNITLKTNKVYYTCYLFYEKLKDYQKCLEIKCNGDKGKNLISISNILIPKVICLSSFSPFIAQSKTILHYLKQNIDRCNFIKLIGNNYDLPSLSTSENNFPIEKIVEGLIYNLPGLPRANFTIKLNKDNFIFGDNANTSSSSLLESESQIIFESSPANRRPKPIINYSLLMKFFRIEEIFEIIKYIILEEPIIFFSQNIQYLTYTIEGLLGLIYPFEYHYPVVAILPEENYSFINIYKCFIFGINDKYSDDIFVLKGINIDDQKSVNIIIIENRFNSLLNSNEKEKSKNSVILHLKPNNSKLLKISQNNIDNSISEIKDLYLKRKNMISEVFKSRREEEEEKNKEKANDKNEEEKKIKLPIHYYVKCCKRVETNYEAKLKEARSKLKDKEIDKNLFLKLMEEEKEKIFSNELTENFLYFFTSIFLHYQEYCTKYQFEYIANNEQSISARKLTYNYRDGSYFRSAELEKKYYTNSLTINDLFNCNLFIDEMPILDKPFYTKFFTTKIFFNFMKKKIFPISLQDKLDILFFDDKCNEKLSRESGIKKIETKFLEYDIKNITGDINAGYISKPITESFKEYLSYQKNRDKALNYFQYITYQNMEPEEKNNSIENYYSNNSLIKINFYYFIFPKLLNDGLFYKQNKKEEENSSQWSSTRTNFSSKNSDCLYNQFEKEANIIIDDENVVKNYNNYYYTLSLTKKNPKPYSYYIKILYFQLFAKIFHQIPFSKKTYYFNYIMLFANYNKDILDDNSIMMMFYSLIKYGDRNMAVNFFPLIRKKTYLNFLFLREKTRQDKNFVKFIKRDLKINLDDIDEKYTENSLNDNYDKVERSLSGYYPSNIRLNSIPNLRSSNCSSSEYDEQNETSALTHIEKREYNFVVEKKINVELDLKCIQNSCDYTCDLKTNEIFNEEKKYMEFQCPKCDKVQELTCSCKLNEEDNKDDKYNIYRVNTKLISPLTLLENDWFKNSQKLNLTYIIENHLEEYFNMIYYFYEQGLLCDFLLSEISNKKTLTKENNISYNTYMQNAELNKNNLITNNEASLRSSHRESAIDISDQKQSFFQFKKNDNKKAPSLITSNIKKKSTGKKTVGFSNKNKKVMNKNK